MTIAQLTIAKIVAVIVLGLPGTVLFLPGIALLLVPGHGDFWTSLLYYLWAAAGFLGLMGFWAWVVSGERINHRGRISIGACILTGVIAVSPFVSTDISPHSVLAVLGIVVGLAICLSFVLSNPTPHPDARGAAVQTQTLDGARAGGRGR